MRIYNMKTLKKLHPHYFLLIVFFISTLSGNIFAQNFPEKPVPPRLVNDFTATLKPEELDALESKLLAFNDSTSTQLAIVILKTLDGYPISEYSFALGEKWGIGQKGKNNGILLLISMSERKIFIAPGYGLEAVLTDAASKRIIETIIKPAFKQKQYYAGLDEATNTIISITKGEFTSDQYASKKRNFPIGIILLIVGIIFLVGFYKVRKTMNYSKLNHVPFWTAWMLLDAISRKNSGHWNNFHSGSGGFGGFGGGGSSGGGFGGFGGGSFGGGGAGGNW